MHLKGNNYHSGSGARYSDDSWCQKIALLGILRKDPFLTDFLSDEFNDVFEANYGTRG